MTRRGVRTAALCAFGAFFAHMAKTLAAYAQCVEQFYRGKGD
jgi:hypothetical protein